VGKPAQKYRRPQWYLNQQILEKARREAQKVIDDSKKPAVRRIVDNNERIPFDVHKYVRKDNKDTEKNNCSFSLHNASLTLKIRSWQACQLACLHAD